MTKAGPVAIINHHAPDEPKDLETKTAHWDLLGKTVSEIQSDAIVLVIGDCNLRWHGRFKEEEDILGPHIFGKGLDYLNEHQHENRDLGVSFLRAHKLYFINSYFKKPPRKTVTYREPFCKHGSLGDQYPSITTPYSIRSSLRR